MATATYAPSLAEQVAALSDEARTALLENVDMDKLLYDWKFWGRPSQFVSDDPYYNVHLFLTGRGFGKTRAGSEWVRDKAISEPGCRIGLLGRTAAEVRDIVVHGESGILGIPQPEEERPVWKSQEAALYWPNGSYAKLYSAEKPDAVRGAQFNYFWADELAAYSPFVGPDGLTAFDNARLATRLGEHPIILVTTTPKRVKSVRELLTEAAEKNTVKIVRGSTNENRSNLSAVYLDVVYGRFDGTSVARQELDGIMLDDDPEGAMWTRENIHYVPMSLEEAKRIPLRIVAVDPSVAENPRDECGIVVVGATNDRLLHKRKAYVLDDRSMLASPEVWAQEVVKTAREWNALGVVVEKNQGHHLLTMALKNIDPNLRVFPVNSSVGKKLRAEPVAQIYEQNARIFHVNGFPVLEDQMVTWEPEITKKSPDRIDALVHGVTALLIDPPKGLMRRHIRASNPSESRLPNGRGTGMARQAPPSRRRS